MALDFPSPAGQTPANTFSPTSTPSATTNGLTYVYDSEKWLLNGTDVFVEVAGDTMTGGLTVPNLTTTSDINVGGQVTLPGGGGATQALQKQEIEALLPSSSSFTPIAVLVSDNSGNILFESGVATVTRANAGKYDVVFDTALTNANYAVIGSCNLGSPNTRVFNTQSKTTTGFRVLIVNGTNSAADSQFDLVVFPAVT